MGGSQRIISHRAELPPPDRRRQPLNRDQKEPRLVDQLALVPDLYPELARSSIAVPPEGHAGFLELLYNAVWLLAADRPKRLHADRDHLLSVQLPKQAVRRPRRRDLDGSARRRGLEQALVGGCSVQDAEHVPLLLKFTKPQVTSSLIHPPHRSQRKPGR